MKKILAILLAALLITSLLASCSGSSTQDTATAEYYNGDDSYSYEESYEEPMAADYDTAGGIADDGTAMTESNITISMTEKIIYSFYADIETTEFDDTLTTVTELMNQFGAFIESSYIGGNSYYSNTTYRYAEYTIRVPVESFASLTGSLDVLGNIVSQNTNAENITTQFTDTQARLDTYQTEEDRLLEMLEKAETVEDMITIESRLSNVRYEIESLTSLLRNWQSQIDYSTVTLHIDEVEELSAQVSAQRTYWERIWDGLNATLEGIGDFFKSSFMVLIWALPVLVLIGAVTVIVLLIVRASRKRKLKKNNNNIGPKE